ncbi:HpcH/HpaI aldolase family protein [Oceanobacillus saliphilus]|uniref:HpcH/HpaI aldolase family protein n=1 Tax=Oceanobacillus saliphilus TaxID=2925834 RepID=UPI00201E69E9|nr:aldolase/citrate lyase family protein [Oceanobacillus saliphilus]
MVYVLNDNKVKKALKTGDISPGIYTSIPSPTIIELAGLAGFEWIRLDWAHAPFDLFAIEHFIRAAEVHGIIPFIRLELDEQKIANVLESGVMGVIVPDIETAADAQAVVNAVKFSPVGNRGMFSSPRKSGYGEIKGEDFKKWTNEEVMIGIQIENLQAIENLDEILNVEGIDMILSGRGDLSNALGVPGQRNHQLVLEAEEKIFEKALKKGRAISPQLDSTDENLNEVVKEWQEKGAKIITFGHDSSIIKHAFSKIISKIKP